MSGPVGTVVHIDAVDCPAPAGTEAKYPSIFFHDPAVPGAGDRSERTIVRIGKGSTVRASYVIRRSDPPGRGLFVIFCGPQQNVGTSKAFQVTT
jgi:hypothetical protein